MENFDFEELFIGVGQDDPDKKFTIDIFIQCLKHAGKRICFLKKENRELKQIIEQQQRTIYELQKV